MSETISKASVCEILADIYPTDGEKVVAVKEIDKAYEAIQQLPSSQPEVIRCNSCKYWTQSTGKMKGYGLGRCVFHDADLVTCNGFCYWAERRTDETDRCRRSV